ncbi:hypothetical protein LTR17_002884 [Elasticomyces elasticus]|nr:hypothetical protein LTR17_002884 [Elasticomyces elasticus]
MDGEMVPDKKRKAMSENGSVKDLDSDGAAKAQAKPAKKKRANRRNKANYLAKPAATTHVGPVDHLESVSISKGLSH